MNRIYWSPTTGGFHLEALSGPRQIAVLDEAEQAKSLETADMADTAEFEAVCAKVEEGGEMPDRADFTRHRREIEAHPILRLVENIDCTLPADAAEITAEQHAALMAGQAQGATIVTGAAGAPELFFPVFDHVAAARATRDAALKASDWTQLADAALSAASKKAWTAHRKRLRDLPALIAKAIEEGRDPAEIEFPEAPG